MGTAHYHVPQNGNFFSHRIGSLALLFSNMTLLFYGKTILKACQTFISKGVEHKTFSAVV